MRMTGDIIAMAEEEIAMIDAEMPDAESELQLLLPKDKARNAIWKSVLARAVTSSFICRRSFINVWWPNMAGGSKSWKSLISYWRQKKPPQISQEVMFCLS